MRERWFWIDHLALLALGLAGGLGAAALGLPLPFMLGSLTLAAIWTVGWGRAGRAVRFWRPLRQFFIAIIGTLIGARFTPELLGVAAALWPSFLAVAVFVILAHAYSFAILRRVGGYDPATAVYAGLPGGLIEAVAISESKGGDVRVVAAHHFVRIILVVVTVPLLFLWLGGESVGSSSGQSLQNGASGLPDLATIGGVAAVGWAAGRFLRLPAGQLMGPLILAAALRGTEAAELPPPGWLLPMAQLVVGAGLGAQFSGVTGRMLARTFWLSLATVAGMIALGAAFALVLAQAVPGRFEPLFISFAPGGMTEMALIALSLDASPVIVTAHHLLRIVFAVFLASWVGRRLR